MLYITLDLLDRIAQNISQSSLLDQKALIGLRIGQLLRQLYQIQTLIAIQNRYLPILPLSLVTISFLAYYRFTNRISTYRVIRRPSKSVLKALRFSLELHKKLSSLRSTYPALSQLQPLLIRPELKAKDRFVRYLPLVQLISIKHYRSQRLSHQLLT